MADTDLAEGNQGNSEFGTEFRRLAREEQSGQAEAPRSDDRLESDDRNDPQPGQEITPPPIDEAAPKEPAPQEASDDIWASAPEHLRNAFQAERAAREKAENASRSNGGRASAAHREAAELRAQLTALKAPANEAPKGEEGKPELPETLKAVQEEYPEVAGPLIEEILGLRQELTRLKAADSDRAQQQQVREELELKEFVAAQETMLAEAHSDWFEVVQSPDFVNWVQTQPRYVHDGIRRNANGIVDGKESADIISRFKATMKAGEPDPEAARRQRQLEGGRTVPARVPAGTTGTEKPTTFSGAWNAMAAQERREAARRN